MRSSPVLAVVALLIGCRGSDPRSSPATKAPPPPPGDPAAAAGPSAASADPWAATTDPDEPPGLAERKQLAEAACPTVSAPYFYRIEKAGKVSHILGTRHIGVPLTKFPPAVHDALATAQLAVFEVAPDDDEDIEHPELALPEVLGPDLWRRYRTLVGSDAASTLERATPSAALLTMMIMYEDITAMLDLEIQRKVLAARIPTRGLESAAFQDALLEKLLDVRMLRASVQHTETRQELRDESRSDLAEYCAGTDDKPGMDDDMRRDLLASGYTTAELDAIDEEMVYARNADWIPKLAPILDRGGAFIAVGADHLSGSRGVIALLAARGYTATRVK